MTTSLLAASGRLSGITALITGSTSGIGEATARRLAAEGARVLISGRDHNRGTQLASDIADTGGQATFLPVDLAAEPNDIRTYAATVTEAADGQLDTLVLNAGIYPAGQTEALLDEELEAMLAVNIRASHVLVGALAPAMVEHGSGVITVISSWMGHLGSPYGAFYSATKAATEQLARSWAAEYGPRGIRVNALAPGATATPGNADYREALNAMTAQTPAGAAVLPEDIAAGVAFLVSPDARMVHGGTLFVDGGITHARML